MLVSLAEVKTSVPWMTGEERLGVAALIAHLNRVEDPEYRAELDRRMAAMDAGASDVCPVDDIENVLTSVRRSMALSRTAAA